MDISGLRNPTSAKAIAEAIAKNEKLQSTYERGGADLYQDLKKNTPLAKVPEGMGSYETDPLILDFRLPIDYERKKEEGVMQCFLACRS